MNIEEQKKAEQFYIESDVNGIHTPRTNMVEINYLDMVKLMHEYAQEQVENLTIPVVIKSCLNCKFDKECRHKSMMPEGQKTCNYYINHDL